MLLRVELIRVLRVVKVKENNLSKKDVKVEEKKASGRIAAIRLRGITGVKHDIKKTMEILRLYRKNYCVVLENKPSYLFMLKKVKDYVTYGEIDDNTYKMLIEKRGEVYRGREESYKGKIKYKNFIVLDNKKLKPFFRLSPPRGGFERKGLKASFKQGGALGYRGDKIVKLIERMV